MYGEIIMESPIKKVSESFVCPIDGGIMKLIRISKSDRNSGNEYLKGCSNKGCSFSEYYNKKVSR